MNIFWRFKNLWNLSTLEPRKLGSEPVKEGTIIAQLIQKPETGQRAVFLPRKKESNIDKITKVAEEQI